MSTGPGTSTSATPSCALFEAQLAEWLEGALDDETRRLMERHQGECAECRSIVLELDAVVGAAGSLPLLSPSRDLWPAIEGRLEAPVIPLGGRMAAAVSAAATAVSPRSGQANGGMSVRRLAIAAAALVAVSSAVTWRVARAPSLLDASAGSVAAAPSASQAPAGSQAVPATPSPDVAVSTTTPAPVAAGESAPSPAAATVARPAVGRNAGVPASTPAVSGAAFVSASRNQAIAAVRAASGGEVNVVYEREIAALRQIVDQRFAELDPATVDELQKNLAIIDQAIADSRKALQSDPRSGLLAGQLDRTLEAKLSLMRRVALL